MTTEMMQCGSRGDIQNFLRRQIYETGAYRKGLVGNVGTTLAGDLEQEATAELVSCLSQAAAQHRHKLVYMGFRQHHMRLACWQPELYREQRGAMEWKTRQLMGPLGGHSERRSA